MNSGLISIVIASVAPNTPYSWRAIVATASRCASGTPASKQSARAA
jgi:hypothetical protein